MIRRTEVWDLHTHDAGELFMRAMRTGKDIQRALVLSDNRHFLHHVMHDLARTYQPLKTSTVLRVQVYDIPSRRTEVRVDFVAHDYHTHYTLRGSSYDLIWILSAGDEQRFPEIERMVTGGRQGYTIIRSHDRR